MSTFYFIALPSNIALSKTPRKSAQKRISSYTEDDMEISLQNLLLVFKVFLIHKQEKLNPATYLHQEVGKMRLSCTMS